uniref:Uncharacterized protein n=1 Tax=Picea glauca TaxID=3330 RepID=A0A101LX31_PICGL|nr:hypothetical protein ABT39_MTgene6384 [Picea glauca]
MHYKARLFFAKVCSGFPCNFLDESLYRVKREKGKPFNPMITNCLFHRVKPTNSEQVQEANSTIIYDDALGMRRNSKLLNIRIFSLALRMQCFGPYEARIALINREKEQAEWCIV